MALFHVNPKTGDASPCRAMVSCPFGDLDTEHYGSAEAARTAYEAKMATAVPVRPVRPPRRPDLSLDHEAEAEELTELLEGSKVVAVDEARGLLKLSNGMTLQVEPNEGCGGCASGNYDLTHLATVDNIITSAKIEVEDLGGVSDHMRYSIYVLADNTQINVATVEGYDGGGWNYGTGFRLHVWK